MKTLAIIGGGNMGGALALGLLRSGAAQVLVCELRPEAREALAAKGVAVTADLGLAATCDALLLAVKPQQLAELAATLAPLLPAGRRVISILAGTPLALLEAQLGPGPTVRAMPNTPGAIGAGMTGICANGACDDAFTAWVECIFASIGAVERIPDEAMMDALTAVSGSGPAYIFRFAEALTAAAMAVGFGPEQAARLVVATLAGSARLLEQEAATGAAELRRRVTSPGGTTAAALSVLEEAGWAAHLERAVIAARDRGRELARLAAG